MLIGVITNIKSFSSLFANNLSQTMVLCGRAPYFVMCTAQLNDTSIQNASAVFLFQMFFSLFKCCFLLSFSISIKS